jgi:Mg2+ and Co2+ transporter CorA
MRILEINPRGEFKERDVTRKEISIEFEAHWRDLRPIFSVRQLPTLSRRGRAVVLNFRSVKILIGSDSVLVFNINSGSIEDTFVPILIESIQKGESRFELQVLESALTYILQKSSVKFENIFRIAESMLHTLKYHLRDEDFEKLLALKKQILKLGKNMRELNGMVDDILEEDEEIRDLVIGKASVKAVDEVESILENALEQIEDISNQIEELDASIDDTQEILTLKMSSRRNVIIQIDLILTMTTAIFSFLAVIVGLFGMNLASTIETSHKAFLIVTIFLGVFATISGSVLWWYLKKKKVV